MDDNLLIICILVYHFIHQGIRFELGAVTIDPMTSAYDPSPLKGYLAQLKVPYFYEEQGNSVATVF